MFTEKELQEMPYGEELKKYHRASGRSVSVSFNPTNGTFLSVEGKGIPGEHITVSCDGDDINAVAQALVTGRFG